MEATHSYEKSLTIFQATGCRNLEAFNLHQHLCEDLGLHKPGNVEKTKGINKGKAERDIGGRAKSTMSIIQYKHTTYADCTVIRSHIRFCSLPTECFTLIVTSLDSL
jgi:hypothetical protein